jgi:hypothetical protein
MSFYEIIKTNEQLEKKERKNDKLNEANKEGMKNKRIDVASKR